jgi:hypothetical protein
VVHPNNLHPMISQQVYKFASVFGLLFLTSFIWANPVKTVPGTDPDNEFVRIFKHEFLGVTNAVDMQFHNQHGDINIHTWDQKKAVVTVRITVRTGTQTDAEDVFNRIKINFTNSNTWAKTQTTIAQSKSWFTYNNDDYQIDYDVFMPADAKLNLINSYGSNYVAPLTNSVVCRVDYGNLFLKGVGGPLKVNLDYGDLSVESSNQSADINVDYGSINYGTAKGSLTINSDYSKLLIENADVINLNTDYTDVTVRKANKSQVHASYGNYNLGQIGHLSVKADYTDFRVSSLANNLAFDSAYGSLRVDKIMTGFSAITAKAAYADVTLRFDTGTSFDINSHVDYGEINTTSRTGTTRVSSSGSTKTYNGTVGSGPKGKVNVNLSYGSLTLGN